MAEAMIIVVGGPVQDTSGRPAFGGSSVGRVLRKRTQGRTQTNNGYENHALCVKLGHDRLLLRISS